MRVCVYRNLNVLKQYGPGVFVWSVAAVKGNVGRGTVMGYIVPEGMEHVVKPTDKILGNTLTLSNTVDNCGQGALKTIGRVGQRSVAAWIIGDMVEAVPGNGYTFTMNPLPPAKGGRSELRFVWSCDRSKLVNWSTVKGCRFNAKGAEAVV